MTPATLAALALTIGVAASALALWPREDDRTGDGPIIEDAGPIHVHGLGVNPGDGALFVATHSGLFRSAAGEARARRVGDRYQVTRGFTVVGENRFLGSGHPDGRDRLPPFLGLIESHDAGRSWRPRSLLGKVDFHVLEAAGRRIYGYGSDWRTRRESLLVSSDGGRSWERRGTPGTLVDLAIDPGDADRVVSSLENGSVYASGDAGRSWRRLDAALRTLAWPAGDALLGVAESGTVYQSGDGGRSWRRVGQVGGEPAAMTGTRARELYVALHDGTVERSRDGGANWAVRSKP
jgi:hypothetical protein